MIGTVTSAARNAYATTTATTSTSKANNSPAQTETSASRDAVKVDLSPGGLLISDLEIILDPKVHMANAQTRLKELMSEMGIPPGTEIDIHLSKSGQFTIEGDNEKLAELQDRLNDGSEMELRNSLVGAQSCTIIQRIAAASQRTQRQVEVNPQNTEALWNAMLAEADRIKALDVDFTFSGGALAGTLTDGTAVSVA